MVHFKSLFLHISLRSVWSWDSFGLTGCQILSLLRSRKRNPFFLSFDQVAFLLLLWLVCRQIRRLLSLAKMIIYHDQKERVLICGISCTSWCKDEARIPPAISKRQNAKQWKASDGVPKLSVAAEMATLQTTAGFSNPEIFEEAMPPKVKHEPMAMPKYQLGPGPDETFRVTRARTQVKTVSTAKMLIQLKSPHPDRPQWQFILALKMGYSKKSMVDHHVPNQNYYFWLVYIYIIMFIYIYVHISLCIYISLYIHISLNKNIIK